MVVLVKLKWRKDGDVIGFLVFLQYLELLVDVGELIDVDCFYGLCARAER